MKKQNSDRFTLDETLEVMERLGRPEEYRTGYEDGVRGSNGRLLNRFDLFDVEVFYRRGHRAGVLARRRGAHKEAS